MKIEDIHESLREKYPDLKEVWEQKHKHIKAHEFEKAAIARELEKQLILKYTNDNIK
jgi:predicted secreted Zn-dependent protease